METKSLQEYQRTYVILPNRAETIAGIRLIVKPEQSLRVLRLLEAARRSNELEK